MLIILVREFIVSGIRMIAATKGEVIAASWYGKAKTVFQIIAIVLFIVKDSLVLPNFESVMQTPLYLLSWLVMLIALALTIVSMVDYIANAVTSSASDRESRSGSLTLRSRMGAHPLRVRQRII